MKNVLFTYRMNQRIATALSLLLAVFVTQLTACASNAPKPPKAPDYFAESHDVGTGTIKNVALVTNSTPTEIEGLTFGVTRGEGAAKGLAGGAIAGGAIAAEGLSGCREAACAGVLLVLLPVFMLGGAAVGGVAGFVAGEPADTLSEAEAKAQQMLTAEYLRTELLVNAEDYARANIDINFIRLPVNDTKSVWAQEKKLTLKDKESDHVLHLDLLRVSLEHNLEMRSRARLISVHTGTVLSDNEYVYVSESRNLDGWMADGAEALTAAINRGLRTLAADAIDENFLLYHQEEPEGGGPVRSIDDTDKHQLLMERFVPHYVLAPVYPNLEMEELFARQKNPRRLKFVEADDRHPTLEWESFPRAFEVVAASNDGDEITNVRYELRVFEMAEHSSAKGVFAPGMQVYEARDLRETSHRIESELIACNDYYWTVRAKFDLDGRTRITEWAGVFGVSVYSAPWNLRRGNTPDRHYVANPEWFYYPLRAECD